MIVFQRDIVLIPFPYTNLKGSKVRPVVVISNDKYNQRFRDFLCIPLTSKLYRLDHVILITDNEMEQGRLPTSSHAIVDRIVCLEQSLPIATIGRINKKTFNAIKKSFLKII